MKIVLAFATANATLRNYLDTRRDAIIPRESTREGYWFDRSARFSVQIHAITGNSTTDTVGEWLRRLAKSADGLIVLIDSNSRPLIEAFEDAYFIVPLPPYPGTVLQNQLSAALAPALRHFAIYSLRFDDMRNQRMLLLPLDVFKAAELVALRQRLTLAKLDVKLADDLDRLLAAISRRARPKTRQKYRTVFYVDDRPLWYRYGPERHAIVQTDKPPHPEKCWHNSLFRFGRKYEAELHHNVDTDAKNTKVYGEFETCHGQIFSASGESHLGIFPNGYI